MKSTMPGLRNRVFTSSYKELKCIGKFYVKGRRGGGKFCVKLYVNIPENLSKMNGFL